MSYKYIIYFLLVVLALYGATHALIYKKDSRAAFGWIAVCLLLPFFGPLLYLTFGINRVQKRAKELASDLLDASYIKNSTLSSEIVTHTTHPLSNIVKTSNHVTKLPLIGGNKIDCLFTGSNAYKEMLDAIEAAQQYIYLCVYIFKRDNIGEKFIQALINAAQRGISVYVLIDGIGQLYSLKKVRRKLLKHNVQVNLFLPPRLIPFNLSINLRNHRKILIVDGTVSFLGGMNISDEYNQGENTDKECLKDIQFKVQGEIILQLRAIFEMDWNFSGGKLESRGHGQRSSQTGPILCRAIIDDPGKNLDHLSIILLSAINSATQAITLMTPYFLPSRELIAAFQAAAIRGVDTIIILPARSNLMYVHWATRHMLWELLQYGVKIFYQPGSFSHSKLFVMDGLYSLIGSANIDPRSLRLNYEVGLEVYDEDFATNLLKYAQTIQQSSREVTLDEVDNRSLACKIRDGIAWLFSPYL